MLETTRPAPAFLGALRRSVSESVTRGWLPDDVFLAPLVSELRGASRWLGSDRAAVRETTEQVRAQNTNGIASERGRGYMEKDLGPSMAKERGELGRQRGFPQLFTLDFDSALKVLMNMVFTTT